MRLKITRRARKLIYLGTGLYFVFLFYTIPASFLTRYVLPTIPAVKGVELKGVSGSIWEGQALNANINRLNLGKLRWELNGWALLLGDVDLALDFASNVSRGSAEISVGLGGSLQAENIQAQFPAEILTPLFYGFPVSFDGELTGNISSLQLEPGRVINSKGRIVWRTATLRSPQHVELGDYLVVLEPNNRGTKLVIRDNNQGPVETNLTIHVKGTGDYKINGWLKPRDDSQQQITEALRLIGRADNSGRYWIVRNGLINGWRI